MFYHGDVHFLLYTERHHFFNRIRVKGIRHLVFYQPPNFPHFYYEMCNLMQVRHLSGKGLVNFKLFLHVEYILGSQYEQKNWEHV
jgi:hypothetical protein